MAHDPLTALEQDAIHVIREACARLEPLGMLWSPGKDSNTMLWLARKAFAGRVPFPVASTASIDAVLDERGTTRREERAGRTMDHEREDAFEGSRAAGYL